MLMLVSVKLSIISVLGFLALTLVSFDLLSFKPSRSNNRFALCTHRYKKKKKLFAIKINKIETYTFIFSWYRFPHISKLLINL